MFSKKLGIIGVGKMGSTMLRRILNAQLIDKEQIMIHDKNESVLTMRSNEFNVDKANSNLELAQDSRYILLAVIPQVINDVLEEIGTKINEHQTIISIAAGVSIEHIQKYVNKKTGIIRLMPNSPALVGAAATALAVNNNINDEELSFVKKIFNSVGMVVELEEKHLDAVTGLSGSGPAYIFIIIESLADGGVKMGLPRDVSVKLAAQTVLGAAKMILETGKHPGELKDMVATPGGTTITALHEIESAKLRATLIRAVEAATLKSRMLNSL
ncbi:MAG: pyrroline-5-carboxylate reductase [Promethearchaeota archaeon]|nr:MAG: pyrroline-5-carboxylate reductase [Candidatus Lokiarchaeota archaeon]